MGVVALVMLSVDGFDLAILNGMVFSPVVVDVDVVVVVDAIGFAVVLDVESIKFTLLIETGSRGDTVR